MMPIRLAPALAVAVLLAPSPLAADDGEAAWPSNRQRVTTHVSKVFGPEALARAALSAGVNQLSDTPDAWDRRWRGYGRRAASQWGTGAIDEGIQLAVAVALDHDGRYQRRGRGPLLGRMGNALAGVVVARDRRGRRVPAWSRLSGAVGAAAVSSIWYPESRGTGRYIATQSLAMIGGDAFGTLWQEFGPDLRRAILHP
jgi:hypothetical protein